MTGNVTLEFYTRTLNDALYTGTLCVYLYKRHEAGSPVVATDTMLTNKTGGAAYWTYTPQGNGFWPQKPLDQGAADDDLQRNHLHDPGRRPARPRAQRRTQQHAGGRDSDHVRPPE